MFRVGQKKGGFTLIELLVVIAIIAILAAILFPVFARAREAARKSSCQSNMKELGTAVALYHGDFDAMMPSSILRVPEASRPAFATWDSKTFDPFARERGNFPPSTQDLTFPSWPELFYAYMKNKDIIWCPSDPNRNDAQMTYGGQSSFGQPQVVVSYYYKAAADYAWIEPTIAARKEGDFDFPSDQVIFYEHNGWHWGDSARGLSNGVTLNMTFTDGHVASKRIQSSSQAASSAASAAYDLNGGGGEPFFYNYWFAYSGTQTIYPVAYKLPFPLGGGVDPHAYGDQLP